MPRIPACPVPAPALALALALLAAPAGAATIAVTTDQDTDLADAFCSLREAIVAANTDAAYRGCAAGSGADRIVFALTPPATLLLASDLPAITGTLKLQGPGADLLTVDGQDTWRLVELTAFTDRLWLGVEGLTLTHGVGDFGGAIDIGSNHAVHLRQVRLLANTATNGGGALSVNATATRPAEATLVECEIAGNEAAGPAGGGGVSLSGPGLTARIEASTLADNRAMHVNGSAGGIYLKESELTVERSTLSGNVATSTGGAILARASSAPARLTLFDSTLVGNQADADGSGAGDGGGLASQTSVTQTLTLVLRNNVIAANEDPTTPFAPDLYFPSVYLVDWQSAGFNLIGTVAGAETFVQSGAPNPDGDRVGTAAAPIDPRLEPLADNGGFAPTHRPLLETTSPVIDQGSCPAATGDQRRGAGGLGGGRIANLATVPDGIGDACDVGAFERLLVARAELPLFSEGFEVGHLLLWSGDVP